MFRGIADFRDRPGARFCASATCLTILFLLLALVAGAQEPETKTVATNARQLDTPSNAAAADRYRIGPADVLDIRIYNRPNLSRDGVRVEGNGMIRMPLIETEIQAA